MADHKNTSARQELGAFVASGNMRYLISNSRGPIRLSEAATSLLINILSNYCEPRRKRRKP